MNVLLVSQCNKNALKETRRILDQFAERRGDRTWQTPITKAGLDTLRKMLRKSARKNTAVACHWIRGANHSELLWVVGNATRFNARGATPTHTTQNDILRKADENDWHTLTDIHLAASIAALFHDFGKACRAFQDKLRGQNPERNRYRHEWISLRLFQAFVGGDDDPGWLKRLAEPDAIDPNAWLDRLIRDGLDDGKPLPMATLPDFASVVAWLIVSHHRLPVHPSYGEDGEQLRIGRVATLNTASLPPLPAGITAAWNEIDAPNDLDIITPYWEFPHGLPLQSEAWKKRARRLARQALEREPSANGIDLDNLYAIHLARLALMLADHHYSSLSNGARYSTTSGDIDFPLFANTDKSGALAQRLDDHLLGVTREVGEITHRLPDMVTALPRIARHKGFRKRSANARFRWQDRAFDLAGSLRERSARQGFFGVNMASTGCGKTLANGRICYALADPDRGTRFTIALGLRTLTLQTGNTYRRDLSLSSDHLAVRVGGQATKALFEQRQAELDERGAGSAEPLLDSDSYVHYDGQIDRHPLLSKVVESPHARALISAPILVCTIDHLMPATESLRGGQQIAPILRLMESDLVLDEPDDFGMSDMPALTRLVYWAGLLGSRVVLSSATLPPAMVEGLFRAYRAGRTQFQNNRGEPGLALDICCAWFDEHDQQHRDCADTKTFRAQHDDFAATRAEKLEAADPRRRGEIAHIAFTPRNRRQLPAQFADQLLEQAWTLHERHHETDTATGHRVSFGLIRMANIGPLFDVARALYAQDAPANCRIHLCVYHSQFPLLARSAIERTLDDALDRRNPGMVYQLPDIRRRLETTTEADQLFIVLGSPVTEVGRDHDYDWAVVEPSSMRSIIQLAGRVRRHRSGQTDEPNIVLLDQNWRTIAGARDGRAFIRPGFEDGDFPLASHALNDLLRDDEYRVIDSRPRLIARDPLEPSKSLTDLEHARMAAALLASDTFAAPSPAAKRSRGRRAALKPEPPKLAAHSAYSRADLWLTGLLPQQQRFRKQHGEAIDLVLLPDEDETNYRLVRTEPQKKGPPIETEVEERLNERVPDEQLQANRITPWANVDYMSELDRLAAEQDMDMSTCARIFGTLQLTDNDDAGQGWLTHPFLGFRKK